MYNVYVVKTLRLKLLVSCGPQHIHLTIANQLLSSNNNYRY